MLSKSLTYLLGYWVENMISLPRLASLSLFLLLFISYKAIADRPVVDVTELNKAKALLVVNYLSIEAKQLSTIKRSEIHLLPYDQWQKNNNSESGFEIAKGKNWFTITLSNNTAEASSAYLTFKDRFQLINVQLYEIKKIIKSIQ